MAKSSELSPVKREQIMRGAREVFRETGYERASVDAIAARAGVSKATIYNHFHDKKALFLATFGAETEGIRKKFLAVLETPTGDIEADLREIAEQLIRLIGAPSHVQRFRLICAEAERFPELGKALHDCSIQVGRERMVRFFERAGAMGLLELADPRDAATDFSALCAGDLSRELHLGVTDRLTEGAIAENVERAVRTFLRAYRPRAKSTTA
jgi:TetR/AcrR family transcriptional regulator, mexJK operon transcriptional repressor